VSTNGIHSLLNLGVQNTSSSPAKAQGQQGLADFLAFFIQQTATVPPATGAVPTTPEATPEQIAAQISPETIQALTAKIALADPKLAESLKGLSPQDFMAKIIALLQKGAPTQEIKPALTSDLATLLAAQVQEQPTPPAATDSAKTDLLKDIIQTLQSFQAADKKTDAVNIADNTMNIAGDAPVAALDPAILAQLTDKIETFLKSQSADTAEHGKADIAQLKTEILQFLKDNGLAEPVIKQYMSALTDSLTAQTVAADAPAPQETAQKTTQNNSAEQNLPAPAQQPHHAAEKTNTAVSPNDKPASLIETQTAKTPENAVQQSTNNSARAPVGGTTAEIQAPPPPQNITAKIAGMNTSASTVSALLQNDSGFNSGNFNGQSDARQTPFLDAGLLKPMTAEGLTTQSFANYMTAAGSTQSSVTQQISLQLQHNINAKIDTLSVQLNPLELGRLDIKLKFAKDGSIKAHMTVDKPETLAMLQKDSAQLEKILQQSGLAVDENALSFDLRQQNQQNLEGFKNGYHTADNRNDTANSDNALQAKLAVETYGYITQSGVNIMV
jgi:flagellar hook-length control protein FliK